MNSAKQGEELSQSRKRKLDYLHPRWKWLFGITITFIMAFFGFLIALIPGLSFIGQLGCAIILAIMYRQIFGYPEIFRSGIEFSAKKLLRLAIILYGLRLNIGIIIGEGLALLARDVLVIAFAVLTMIWLAKIFKADMNISLLLGVGTGVCGAAAIAAVGPIIKSKDDEIAVSVGIIALIGTVFSVIYTLLRPILPLSSTEYGAWSGMSLHELAHVALAAAPAGQDALAIALLAKLGRVFLLIPLCFIIIYIIKRKKREVDEERTKISFPWFLLGFIAMSIIGSYIIGPVITIPEHVIEHIYTFSTWLLTAAMVGLGLSVNLHDVKTKAAKPLAAMLITSAALTILTIFLT